MDLVLRNASAWVGGAIVCEQIETFVFMFLPNIVAAPSFKPIDWAISKLCKGLTPDHDVKAGGGPLSASAQLWGKMQTAQSAENPGVEQSTRFSCSREWPGERHPTRWDVHDANESPAIKFLDRFRAALLHSEGMEAEIGPDPDLAIDDSDSSSTDAYRYTYPMVLLSDVPTIVPEDELARLQSEFFASFKHHIFINAVDVGDSTSTTLPPYLQLALACLASTTSPTTTMNPYIIASGTSQAEVSAGLFVAGVNLWSVMLEVDNREARVLEAVIAASLLATYGQMTGEKKHWRKASTLLCNVVTISRRLHLTDNYSLIHPLGEMPEKDCNMRSALISYLLLLDTMQAAHCGLAPNLSTSELFIRMPSSSHPFQNVYSSLLHGRKIPQDVRSREDALLLLTALLSDIVYIQRCHLSLASISGNRRSAHIDSKLRNPFAPLTSQSEFSRLTADMAAALSRWGRLFQDHVGSDILALYFFCKLQLICPDLWKLPQMAGYGEMGLNGYRPTTTEQFEVPEKALDLPWLVLEHCDKNLPEHKFSVWLPVVVFLSALVLWQRLRSQPTTDLKYGTLRVLSTFRNEIAHYLWPCSVQMVETLDRLMKKEP